MPTTKKRINITIDDETYKSLDRISKRENVTLSSAGLRLIAKALELEEDIYFSQVADDRLSEKQRRVSHKKAWGS